MRRMIIAAFMAVAAAATLAAFLYMGPAGTPMLDREALTAVKALTGAGNAVAGIYLNYRVFDTLFEALLLLMAVVGVEQFSRLESGENRLEYRLADPDPHKYSPVLSALLRLLYPLMLLFGFYILYTGADAPGGGFQGGAILAAVVMSRYLADPGHRPDFHRLEGTEKIIFALILVMVTVFVILPWDLSRADRAYLTAMNLLIGGKVGFGLIIVFLQFVHRERKEPS